MRRDTHTHRASKTRPVFFYSLISVLRSVLVSPLNNSNESNPPNTPPLRKKKTGFLSAKTELQKSKYGGQICSDSSRLSEASSQSKPPSSHPIHLPISRTKEVERTTHPDSLSDRLQHTRQARGRQLGEVCTVRRDKLQRVVHTITHTSLWPTVLQWKDRRLPMREQPTDRPQRRL